MIKQVVSTLHQLEALNAAILHMENQQVKLQLLEQFLPMVEQNMIDFLQSEIKFGDQEK
jgi:hypothetical protein